MPKLEPEPVMLTQGLALAEVRLAPAPIGIAYPRRPIEEARPRRFQGRPGCVAVACGRERLGVRHLHRLAVVVHQGELQGAVLRLMVRQPRAESRHAAA